MTFDMLNERIIISFLLFLLSLFVSLFLCECFDVSSGASHQQRTFWFCSFLFLFAFNSVHVFCWCDALQLTFRSECFIELNASETWNVIKWTIQRTDWGGEMQWNRRRSHGTYEEWKIVTDEMLLQFESYFMWKNRYFFSLSVFIIHCRWHLFDIVLGWN